MHNKNKLKFRIAAILFSMMFTLLALEVIVRYFFWQQVSNEALEKQNRTMFIGDIVRVTENLGLEYELRPNLDMEWKNVKLYTDAKGECRVGDPATVPSEGIKIAVIGDSTAFGWGVSYENSYPEVLRHKLSKVFSQKIILRNYSVPGYNSKQHYFCLYQKVLEWKPDLLLFHYDHNDSGVSQARPWHIHSSYGDNFLHSALIKFCMRHIKIIERKAMRDKNKSDLMCEGFFCAGKHFEKHVHYIQDIAKMTKKYKIPVMFIIFDANLQYNHSPENDLHYQIHHKKLIENFHDSGFFICDLYHLWQKTMKDNGWQDQRKLWLTPHDMHPNIEGHYLMADYILDFIQKQPEIYSLFKRN